MIFELEDSQSSKSMYRNMQFGLTLASQACDGECFFRLILVHYSDNLCGIFTVLIIKSDDYLFSLT